MAIDLKTLSNLMDGNNVDSANVDLVFGSRHFVTDSHREVCEPKLFARLQHLILYQSFLFPFLLGFS